MIEATEQELGLLTLCELKSVEKIKRSVEPGSSKMEHVRAGIRAGVLLQDLRVEQLREILEGLKLSKSGRKQELIDKIYLNRGPGADSNPHLELQRLFEPGQVVSIYRNNGKVATEIINSIPAAELFRSNVNGKREKVYQQNHGKDLYTQLTSDKISVKDARVDHVLECQLGAMAWGAATSSVNSVRAGLRSNTELIKPIWNDLSNLNVTTKDVNYAKCGGTKLFKNSILDGCCGRGYMAFMEHRPAMTTRIIRNMAVTIEGVSGPLLDKVSRATQLAMNQDQYQLLEAFEGELAALMDRMNLQYQI